MFRAASSRLLKVSRWYGPWDYSVSGTQRWSSEILKVLDPRLLDSDIFSPLLSCDDRHAMCRTKSKMTALDSEVPGHLNVP